MRKWQMAAFQEEWLKEMTVVPEGNQAGSAGWAATIREVSPTHMMAISHYLRRFFIPFQLDWAYIHAACGIACA